MHSQCGNRHAQVSIRYADHILLYLTGHASVVIGVTVFYLEPRTVHLPPIIHYAMPRLDHDIPRRRAQVQQRLVSVDVIIN
jgi:hypothetical protein